MSKTRVLSISFIMACMLCACGEDSQSVSTSGGDSDLCGGKQCKSNQKCVNNKCVSDDDDSDEVCKKTQNTCADDETLKKCVKGKKPVLEDCDSGYCEDGECLEKGGNQDEDVCKKTEEYCASKKELITCVKGEKPKRQKCSDLAEGSECIDSQCTAGAESKAGIGDPCTDSAECIDGAYCDVGSTDTCVKFSTLGEPCSETQCSTDLMCFEDVCVKKVNIGEQCDEHAICDSGDCRDGICVAISTEYGECNEQLACPYGSVCIDKTCVPTKGSCSSNGDCTGDSYCCVDESCKENINVCVPYSSENSFDPECKFKTVKGMFEAAVQCYWVPKIQPGSTTVYNSVAVGRIHNAQGIEKPLLAFITESPQMLRVINSETCEDIESINLQTSSSYNHVSLADFDGDGYMEMVVYSNVPVIYKWDPAKSAHVPTKVNKNIGISSYNANFSIHDLDNDGVPEIIATNGAVMHADGTVLSQGNQVSNCSYTSPALGDLNGDGNIEFIANNVVYRWMPASNGWTQLAAVSAGSEIQAAYADFGTPGSNPSQFDFMNLDGKAEIVLAGGGSLEVWAIFDASGSVLPSPQAIMQHRFSSAQHWGYPPAIGDFNGDGKPEIGVASKSAFGVYDPKCAGPENGKCKSKFVIWESATHDVSGIAGASAFDFDGDGQIEIVYGDEQFTRVYDGVTGEVLFSSYRNSGTVIEYPIIADVDDDGSTEIVISSDSAAFGSGPDSSHRGVKCEKDSDCYSGSCVSGLCRCTNDNQCNWQTINGEVFRQYSCLAPLAGDAGGGNVCRATQGKPMPGVTVLRDRLDRWVSSRPVWNQHAYNITNVNDDGKIPKTSDWKQNFTTEGLNNYRQQIQGSTGAGVAPDITGRFTSAADACSGDSSGISLKAQVCNRGTKAVGSKMPAVFYKESIAPENILCVSYTEEMVPVKDCRDVSCNITPQQAEELRNVNIILVVNDDGKGGKTTVECNESNNTDKIKMAGCQIN